MIKKKFNILHCLQVLNCLAHTQKNDPIFYFSYLLQFENVMKRTMIGENI